MRLFTKTENWSLIALCASLVLAYAFCLAPGHRHMFGDLSDPLSTAIAVMMAAATVGEIFTLFVMSRTPSSPAPAAPSKAPSTQAPILNGTHTSSAI